MDQVAAGTARAGSNCASSAPTAPDAWADVVARYLEALRVTHYAATTVHVRMLYLKYFTTWATARGLAQPADITRADVERYQRWLYDYRTRTGGPLSVWSQHGRLVAVKGLFRWLAKRRALATNPAAELELPRVTAQRLPQPLTDAEITQVLAHADPTTAIGLRDRAILETGYSTGLRRTELIRLRLYDLDLARGVLAVREGKGHKDRVVPIGERAIAWLGQYLDEARPQFVVEPDNGTVFLTRTGRRFHPNHLSRLARDHIVAAGVAKRGACHLLRHTMATVMLEHGADIRVIQEILGHARLTTTQLYTRVSIRLLKAVHTATHPAATLGDQSPRRPPPAPPRSRSRPLLS
ncbi:MAG: site-specific tyrosine recombinase XerC [Candidatus Rokuibacteriota bacterium]